MPSINPRQAPVWSILVIVDNDLKTCQECSSLAVESVGLSCHVTQAELADSFQVASFECTICLVVASLHVHEYIGRILSLSSCIGNPAGRQAGR